MKLKLTNNADTTLAGALTTGATTVLLAPGTGAKFPSLAEGEFFPLTLVRTQGGEPVREIVYATARNVDSLTVLRAQEGTIAATFSAGDYAGCHPTAGCFASKADTDGATFTGDVDLSDKKLTQAVLTDCADAFYDNGSGNTIDLTKARVQRWSPGVGQQTLTITGWPPSGAHGELLIYGMNLGGSTITIAGAPVNFRNDNGSNTQSNNLNANHGVALQTSGINFILIWSPDGGQTRYCKVA